MPKLDAKHWLERAQEALAIAQRITDNESREAILRIVHGYRMLAARAAARDKDTDEE